MHRSHTTRKNKYIVLTLSLLCLIHFNISIFFLTSTQPIVAQTVNNEDVVSSDTVSTSLVPNAKSLLLNPDKNKLNFGRSQNFSLDSLDLSSEYILIRELDPSSPETIFDYASHKADERIFPASMTKLMTSLLIIEALENNTIKEDNKTFADWTELDLDDPEAVSIGLEYGDEATVIDLLHACLLPSANDAANVITGAISDSIFSFVDLMNERAKELSMFGTHFNNPSGLSDPNNYSTLNDIAILLEECIKHPLFTSISSKSSYDMSAIASHPDGFTINHSIENYKSAFDREFKYVTAGKTGFIEESRYNFASYHSWGTRMFIVVSSKAEEYGENILDHEKIYEYFFDASTTSALIQADDLLARVKLEGGKDIKELDIKTHTSLNMPIPAAAHLSDFKTSLGLPHKLEAPIEANQVLGHISVLYSDPEQGATEIFRENLTLNQDIQASKLYIIRNTSLKVLAYVLTLAILLLLVYLVSRSFRKKASLPKSNTRIRKKVKNIMGSHFDDFDNK